MNNKRYGELTREFVRQFGDEGGWWYFDSVDIDDYSDMSAAEAIAKMVDDVNAQHKGYDHE